MTPGMKSWIAAATVWCVAVQTQAQSLPTENGQHAMRFESTLTKTIQMGYLLFLPKAYGQDQETKWPLILFLHGLKVRGTDPERIKEQFGPPSYAEQHEDFPFIVLSPQCPRGDWWKTDDVMALLDEIVKQYRVDEDRLYVTGLSMGGYGAWAVTAENADRFAALAPVSGGGTRIMAYALRKMPIWAFHNSGDRTVPVEESKRMIEILQKLGSNPQLTVYDNDDHDSWTETYNNPKLYEWFLSHKRNSQ